MGLVLIGATVDEDGHYCLPWRYEVARQTLRQLPYIAKTTRAFYHYDDGDRQSSSGIASRNETARWGRSLDDCRRLRVL